VLLQKQNQKVFECYQCGNKALMLIYGHLIMMKKKKASKAFLD